MQPRYRPFSGAEPVGTIVVRVVQSTAGPRAFIRDVSDPSDIAQDAIQESEELAVDEALALARNKAANIDGGAEIVIDLGPQARWDIQWGQLDP